MAAGVGLTPGIARAEPGAVQVDQGAAAAATAGEPTPPGFSSPAERTVVASKGAVAPLSASSNTTITLRATPWEAHMIDLQTFVDVSDAASVEVTISWGDDSTSSFSADVPSYPSDIRTTRHTYAAVGSYDVKVTVKDTTHDTVATNEVKVTTEGAEFTPHAPTRLLDTREGIGAAKAKVPARSSVALKVAGAADVPIGAAAVALNVTVTDPAGPGHISVESQKSLAEGAETSNLNFVAGQTVANMVVSAIGADGYVYLYNAGWEPLDLIADVTGFFTHANAAGYVSVVPVRAVDTREGLGSAPAPVAGQSSLGVQIAGRDGAPKGVTAVALNLTVTGPQEAGHLTAYPSGQTPPTTSNLNFTPGQTVANAVIVPVGPDGTIRIRNGSWRPADVVVDVVGYYTPESRSAFVAAVVPFRVVDSRKDKWGRKAGPLAARSYYAMRNEGDTTTPHVDGWMLNITVTNTSGPGFLSVAPDPYFWSDYEKGTPAMPERPVASAVNWTAGTTAANVAQTPGGKGGIIDIWNQGWGDVDFMADLLGYYSTR
ncbi:hypothetical protein [Streptomyces sp. CB03911]|uniref:hypothetical protein n=1 Tax=Streptomycetaceae TaxID=2062 RepID=UPI00093DB567|nr:hypothetical protein [Streptomyces sp. CB03911]OKI17586.1 hypothetical protein A6A07_39855 [Streptomyces sp. CB03911]